MQSSKGKLCQSSRIACLCAFCSQYIEGSGKWSTTKWCTGACIVAAQQCYVKVSQLRSQIQPRFTKKEGHGPCDTCQHRPMIHSYPSSYREIVHRDSPSDSVYSVWIRMGPIREKTYTCEVLQHILKPNGTSMIRHFVSLSCFKTDKLSLNSPAVPIRFDSPEP